MKKLITAAIILTGLTAFSQKNSLNQKNIKMEQQQIIQTITSIFNGSDERNWSKVENAMADNVLLDYTSMAGGKPSTLSPKQITDAWAALLPGFQSTHHQIGNYTVNVWGNEAVVNFHGLALHYLPNDSGNDVWTVIGTYDYHLVKVNGTWKTDKLKFNLQKQEGNLQLPVMAQENVKSKVNFKTTPVSTETKKVVAEFFTALEKLNIPAFLKVWADNGKQIMPLAPQGFPSLLSGKEAINNQYKALPENYTSMSFPFKIYPTENPNKAIVQYTGTIPLKDGGEYNNNYVGIFEIRNGKLQQFTEYFDPFILEEAFGQKLQSNFNVQSTAASIIRKVEFLSEGLVLKGNLHLPANFSENKQYKGIVVTGSWTTVKEQMPDLYANKLAQQGFVALTFDFRNYGESEGQPRNFEVPEMKAQDIINATNFLKTLSFIDKESIGGLAVCASSGYMALALANGADLKAVNFIAPWLHNAELVRMIYGGAEGVADKIKHSDKAKTEFAQTGKIEYVPAISTTNKEAAMFGDFDYYLNPKRGAIKEWGNQFAVMAWRGWLEFDPVQLASKINVPLQIIHSQSAAVPQGAEQFYKNLKGTKNIIWVDKAIQFDFYDQQPYTTNAANEAGKWFEQQL